MLLRPATRNCGRNISPLFKIAATKFHNAKFKALPLLRVQLRPLPPLFITLVLGQSTREEKEYINAASFLLLTNLSPKS
jgi:hypothetical protein